MTLSVVVRLLGEAAVMKVVSILMSSASVDSIEVAIARPFSVVRQRRQIADGLHMMLGRRLVCEVKIEEQVTPVHAKQLKVLSMETFLFFFSFFICESSDSVGGVSSIV